MPPRSYLVTAAVLVALVAISLPMTMGFAIIAWYWLFAAAACVLVVVGVVRIVHGLGAPAWIGAALASPGLLWAADSLLNMTPYRPMAVAWILLSSMVTSFAFLAAAASALRLIEIFSKPHVGFRIGYGLLAISALLSVISLTSYFMGWSFTKDPLYLAFVRPFYTVIMLVKYGAFIGAAVMVTLTRNMERWIAVTIGLVGLILIYEIIMWTFATGLRGDTMFWLKPVLFLVGSAAVWRIGSLLHVQSASQRYAQS